MVSEADRGEVYVQVSSNANQDSVAVGDEYITDDDEDITDGDEGSYQWSVKTEIPDLAAKRTVSVSDVMLFPDQLNGKIVGLEFNAVEKIVQKSAEEYSASISCGRGHPPARIEFPAAGLAFFKEIANHEEEKNSQSHTVYALITVSPKGIVSLEAKGARVSEEEGDAEYRW